MLERWFTLWGKLPTTQARITVTLACVIATTVRYVVSEQHVLANGQLQSFWEPSWQWLGFLIAMSGLDAAQYFGKRTTDTTYVAAKQGTPPAPQATDPATTA
jgi:hypothetical protein